MKDQLHKEGLIEARVNRFTNISQRIKEFINQKSSCTYTPFQRDQEIQGIKKGQQKAKRSLTDWRQLYIKNNNKINPNSQWNITAQHFKKRCSITGQCQRKRKIYTASKANSIIAQRHFLTSQSKRARQSQSKRQILIQFALAQTCYQNSILKDQRQLTTKQRKFYQRKRLRPNNLELSKVGQYLSHVSEFKGQQLRQINTTQKFINKIKDFEHIKMAPFNLVKIKDKCKIDNSRYKQIRGRSSENGLRYYERA